MNIPNLCLNLFLFLIFMHIQVKAQTNKQNILSRQNKKIAVMAKYSIIITNEDSSLLCVKDNTKKFGLINKIGEQILPFAYDYIKPLKNGLIILTKNRKYGICNKQGQILQPIEYQYIGKNRNIII